MSEKTRWGCRSCGWAGLEPELLTAPNPFDPEQTICGCPECKGTDEFEELCDEPGCNRGASCGFPTAKGYRRTCGRHYAPAEVVTRTPTQEQR